MARAKKKFSPRRKKRGGKKYARRRKSSRGFKRVECQLGRAALMYSRAKGYLSRVEKGAARGKAENPGNMDANWGGVYDGLAAARSEAIRLSTKYGIPINIVRPGGRPGWSKFYVEKGAYAFATDAAMRRVGGAFVERVEARGKAENPATRFRVHVRGKNVYYPSLEAARRATDDYFRRTGIVLGIEAVGGKHRNPKLRPFAGAKGPIKYPFFEVLGRKFDDLDTAKAFADIKAEESDKPVDVMSKPDSWTMAYEAYVAYPSSMSKAERKEFHDQRWHPRVTANPRQHFKEMTKADIGKYVEGFGYILKGDVGKRMYRVGGIIQVENNEQRDRRVKSRNPVDIATELGLARNMFGRLTPDIRKRLQAVVDHPSEKTWNNAYSIIIGSDRSTTLWQAIRAVDKTFTARGPASWKERGKWVREKWSTVPTRQLLLRALAYATH